MAEERKITGYPSIDKPWQSISDEREHQKLPTHVDRKMNLPSQEKKHLEFFPPESNRVYNNNQNLYDYLLDQNKGHFNEVALTFGQLTITYEELHTRIDEYAKALYLKGVRKGDIVALCIANTPEAVFLFYAINKLGAITCQINPMDNAYKMMKDFEVVKPKMIISINDAYGRIKKAQRDLSLSIDTIIYPAVRSMENPLVKMIYGVNQIISGNTLIRASLSLDKILSNARTYHGIVEYPTYIPDSLSNIIFTGGSSGIHKGVDLSSNGLNNLMDAYSYFNLLEPGDVFMGHLPMFMGFGILAMHYALCSNANLYLTFKALPKDFISELDRIHPAAAFGGPIHWETLITNEDAKKLDLSNLKEPVSGGEQLVFEKWLKINEVLRECNAPTTLWNGFGMSEMWSASALNRGKINSVGTVGVVYPCNNVKIVDMESEEELGYDQIGRYYVTGPSMMLGYHNNLKETDKVFKTDKDGVKWLSTGDLARISKNGEITFLGRVKRCFVSGVTNIYPEQIEDLLCKLPQVSQAIVTHVKCTNRQNVPIYHIQIKDPNTNKKRLTKTIKSYITQTLGESAVAYDIVFTDKPLPVTANGKLDPKPLQEEDNRKYTHLTARQHS